MGNGFSSMTLLCLNKGSPQMCGDLFFQEQDCAGNHLREHTQVFAGALTLNPASVATDRGTKGVTKDTPLFPSSLQGEQRWKGLVTEQAGDKPEGKPDSHSHQSCVLPAAVLQAGLSGAALEERNQGKLLRDTMGTQGQPGSTLTSPETRAPSHQPASTATITLLLP